MKLLLAFAASVALVQPGFAGERARSPADATVLVRLVGAVHAEIFEQGQKRVVDRNRIEIGTGSGFVISPDGHVLTNEHVVSNSEVVINDGFTRAVITLKVSKIEVCFPAEIAAARGGGPCSEASVYATDPALDLAVLYVSSSNQPYLAFGDSDVVTPGQPVHAIGFPFGRMLDIGRATGSGLVPEITTTAGTISALRAGDTGERRFLQVDANVNPGNSGGPLVNRDGFAVGVMHSRLKDGSGIGFAIPINQAKTFLESRGLDQLAPARRLRLGALQRLDAKGIALRMPEGLADASPLRSRIETEPSPTEIVMRIDRLLSPWPLNQIEQQLVGTQTFEHVSTTTRASRASRVGGVPALLGHAADSSADIGMAYAVLDLGREKLLARFVGPSEQLAYNEAVLRDSLASLEGERLLVGELEPVEAMAWSTVPAAQRQNRVPVPIGWVLEPGAPTACPGLSNATTTGTAVAVRDFTVVLRVAMWPGAVEPDEAASVCSSRRGSLGRSSYTFRTDWLGVSYSVEGIFVRVGAQQVLQLEVLSPDQKSPFARALLAAWVKKATE